LKETKGKAKETQKENRKQLRVAQFQMGSLSMRGENKKEGGLLDGGGKEKLRQKRRGEPRKTKTFAG